MEKRRLPTVKQNEEIGTKRALRHWHPVLLAKDLKNKPVGVKVLGEPIVLFRTPNGVGAVHDRCPHRGAKLSAGHVENGKVVCPYHLWCFDKEGKGQSPVNPKMRPFTQAFDVAEHAGLFWVRAKGSSASLPTIDTLGLPYIDHHAGVIDAPFYVVVDNFTEIEHSPTNHFVFAFDKTGIREVEPHVEIKKDSILIRYEGPQRNVPWWTFASMVGLKPGTKHIIEFEVRFNPMQWIYNFYWEDPKTGQRLPQRILQHAFITPRDDGSTAAFLQFYATLPIMKYRALRPAIKRIFMTLADHEFNLDKRICENVAEMGPQPGFDGLQLGKFDRVLRQTRKFISEIYDGPPEAERVEVALTGE